MYSYPASTTDNSDRTSARMGNNYKHDDSESSRGSQAVMSATRSFQTTRDSESEAVTRVIVISQMCAINSKESCIRSDVGWFVVVCVSEGAAYEWRLGYLARLVALKEQEEIEFEIAW